MVTSRAEQQNRAGRGVEGRGVGRADCQKLLEEMKKNKKTNSKVARAGESELK